MEAFDKVQLLAELENSFCELNHGPNTKKEDYQAVDYIIMPIGYKENEIKTKTIRELVIPVCTECAEALQGEEWTLLFCFDCSANQWVYRKLSRMSYRHHILWLDGCPKCTNEFGGLYFNDAIHDNNIRFIKDVCVGAG